MSSAGIEDGLRLRALAVLRASRIFGLLPSTAVAQLAQAGHLVALERGAVLFLEGEEGDAAYVVLEGELEVRTVGKDGRELRIAAHPEGGLIGEMAALDGARRSADVVAARRCRLWRVPRPALLDTLRSHPDAALALLGELSGRLRAANAALERASRRDLEAQLAFLLLSERNRVGAVALTQTEMARRISFSREKVNRRLHAWADEGIVAIERQGVLIRAPERLAALAS
ncbi:MAG TPA: Crp/Fnr family transcriptional regulator [Caulobacteraceae bacterium]|jgi:CRP-like cAMP-binding protein